MIEDDRAMRLIIDCLDLLTHNATSAIAARVRGDAPLGALGVRSPKALKQFRFLLSIHPLSGVPRRGHKVFEQQLSSIEPGWSVGEVIRAVASSPLTGIDDTDER